jgi:TonB family protein
LALALAGCGSSAEEPTPPATTVEPIGAPPTSLAPATTVPPPTTTAAPPPDTTVGVGVDSISSATHTTDDSTDPAHHAGHWHTHAPVGISGHHISGGATAFQPPVDEGPSGTVRFTPLDLSPRGPGTFDTAVLVRMLHSRQAAVRACYLRTLRTDATAAGTVRVEMTIAEAGTVEASIASDETGRAELTLCLVQVTRSLRFSPGPEGGTVTYTVPWIFESQDPLASL